MFEKYIAVNETDIFGQTSVSVLDPSGPMVKIAAEDSVHPAILKYITNLVPEKNKIYVLINALGSGEFYGSNSNGDFFEEKELQVDNEDIGYRSFEKHAHIFRNHQNKDVERSFGDIPLSVYNPKMHRVELIAVVDREKAAAMGHDDLVSSLDSRKRVPVSMGCRVKFDVCNVCGNEAPTRADYCSHARDQMGETLEDGVKVAVYNPRPKFFDLSFVIVGADKTSFAMSKLASVFSTMEQELVQPIRKTASPLLSKEARDMIKTIPGMAEKLNRLKIMKEAKLRRPLLDKMASVDFSDAITTVSSLGIILRPDEYAYVALRAAGMDKEANQVIGSNAFPVSTGYKYHGDLEGNIDKSIVNEITAEDLHSRSIREPFLTSRFPEEHSGIPPTTYIVRGDLDKIASAYYGYRAQLLTKVATMLNNIPSTEIAARSLLSSDPVKASILAMDRDNRALPLSTIQMAYLYGAYDGVEKATATPVEDQSKLKEFLLLGMVRAAMAAREGATALIAERFSRK